MTNQTQEEINNRLQIVYDKLSISDIKVLLSEMTNLVRQAKEEGKSQAIAECIKEEISFLENTWTKFLVLNNNAETEIEFIRDRMGELKAKLQAMQEKQ
jgi:hypothetical protein